ncbi:MAG: DUF2723 domain-containing protein, partial [Bacteroidota bacterium]
FAATLLIYLLTLAPTVVFWDVGEFIAAAKMMQVPHPPGSPLFLLGARIAMMIPFAADQAVRAHALSAFLSAMGIMFLYLVIVRLITNFRGIPATTLDRITVYGSAIVGALSLAVSTTYWDNAIEAEVYGASMFFLSSVIWLALRWLDRSEEEGNEKYLLLIAYLIGLSLGVHLLALLAIFPVLMIIYFKKYEVTFNSFAIFSVIAFGVFAVVYPGIVKYVPGMMDGEWGGKKSEVIAYIPWIVIALVCYGVYSSYKKRRKMLHLALSSILLIFLGYTTYTSVIIRSNANPPMNENDPSNLARLTSYLGREQYGTAPLFMPRRYSQEPHQQEQYTKYSSDMDFLLRYQLNHMFFRYLFWNYIGAAGDAQDSTWSARQTWAVPFLIGLLGLYYQFKKDWKMGLVFLTAFIILGPMLALYQNQQEPQPRERDYFYVGAFFVFSAWIAMGVAALIEYARRGVAQANLHTALAGGVAGLCVLAVPANLVRVNYHDHDRSGNYVAWDYSYNMLQTCEKDAILFTNGDNDTFPLWYLQDVEGVRRDVRIVNLSLVNTPWYIQQMKNNPYYEEAQAVPISFSDSRIANIQPQIWEPRMVEIPVPPDVYARYGITDTSITNGRKLQWTMRNTLQFGQTRAIRVQDIMVLDIIRTNQWRRPIFFAVTCSPDSKIGLDDYLWFQGLAQRLEPRRVSREDMGIDPGVVEQNLFHEPEGFSKTPQYGYKFRRVNDPKVYFDENITRLMLNLRSGFIRLAMYYANVDSNMDKAAQALDRMEYLIPRSKVPMGWELESDLANFYHRIGRIDKFNELASSVETEARRLLETGQFSLNTMYNPYRALIDIYELRKDYDKELEILKDLQSRYYPNDPGLKQRIAVVEEQARRAGPPPSPPAQ